jgi:hypothetical protein
MALDFAGTSWRRWLEYLVAVLLGNAIYYFSFVPHLPEPLRHRPFRLDGGMFVDFAVCVGVYALIRFARKL